MSDNPCTMNVKLKVVQTCDKAMGNIHHKAVVWAASKLAHFWDGEKPTVLTVLCQQPSSLNRERKLFSLNYKFIDI